MKKRLLKTLLITLFAGSIVTNIVLWDISKTYEKKYTEICNAFGIDVEMSNKEAVQYIVYNIAAVNFDNTSDVRAHFLYFHTYSL